jgi:hypothetical protein
MFNTLSISCLEIYFFFGLSMMELLLSFFLIINYYIIIIIEFFLKTKRFKLTSIVKEDLREFVMEDVEEVECLREMDLYSEPSSKLLSKKLKKKIGKIYILLFFYKMLFYIQTLIFLTKARFVFEVKKFLHYINPFFHKNQKNR